MNSAHGVCRVFHHQTPMPRCLSSTCPSGALLHEAFTAASIMFLVACPHCSPLTLRGWVWVFSITATGSHWLITPWRDLRIYPICVDLPLQSILSRRRWVPAGPLISHLLTLMLTPYLGGAKWLQCFLGTWIPIRGRLWSANPECRQEALLMRLVLRLPSSDEGDRQFGGMLVLAVLDRCADPVCLWSQTLVMALMVLPFHQCLQTATEDVLQGAPNKHLWQRYVMERDNWTETGLGQLMRVVYFVVWWTCAWLGKGPNLLPGILGGALPVSTWPCAQSQVHKEIGFWVLSGGTWFGFTDLWDDSKHI